MPQFYFEDHFHLYQPILHQKQPDIEIHVSAGASLVLSVAFKVLYYQIRQFQPYPLLRFVG